MVRSALSLSSAQQIGGTIFHMWNAVFHFNFFGPSGVCEVVGVSFRNTAGIGGLTASLFFCFQLLLRFGFPQSQVKPKRFSRPPKSRTAPPRLRQGL